MPRQHGRTCVLHCPPSRIGPKSVRAAHQLCPSPPAAQPLAPSHVVPLANPWRPPPLPDCACRALGALAAATDALADAPPDRLEQLVAALGELRGRVSGWAGGVGVTGCVGWLGGVGL